MKNPNAKRPLIIGGLMGLMLLWMAHQQMTNPSFVQGAALMTFVGAHLAILAVVLGGAIFASRMHPLLRQIIAKLHRPSWQHMRNMALGMAISAGSAHLIIHGGL